MTLEAFIGLLMILGGFSHVFDSILKEESIKQARQRIFQWWIKLGETEKEPIIQRTAEHFVELFNKIYGEKHLSRKCFLRSCLFSILSWIICVFVVWLIFGPFIIISLPERWYLLPTWLFINMLADYISLSETRSILKLATKLRGIYYLPLLVADLIFSFACYYVIGIPILALGFFILGGEIIPTAITNYFNGELFALVYLAIFTDINLANSFLYSTFFSSFLFYLFLLFNFLLRLFFMLKISTMIMPILKWMSDTSNPVKASAGVCAAIVVIVEGIKKLGA